MPDVDDLPSLAELEHRVTPLPPDNETVFECCGAPATLVVPGLLPLDKDFLTPWTEDELREGHFCSPCAEAMDEDAWCRHD